MDPTHRPTFGHRLLTGAVGFVGLLVLYALSVGPAIFVVGRVDAAAGIPLIETLYYPLFVAVNRTPLERPLQAYMRWWMYFPSQVPPPRVRTNRTPSTPPPGGP